MTQIYNEDGTAVPVTVLEAGPCHVLQVKSIERDGYEAVQVGFADRSRERASRSERGHVAALTSKRSKSLAAAGVAVAPKAGCEPKRMVRELRGATGLEVGAVIKVEDALADAKSVDVIGVTKGRGFAGVMKRHGFKGQRASHGVKKVHRHQGGTGQNTSPARVFKGKRMAGRYGNERSTMRNVKLVRVDKEANLLLVRGAVPGPNGSFVTVRKTNKFKKVAVAAAPKKKGAK
jgi:large subunit ribosomal protein L3